MRLKQNKVHKLASPWEGSFIVIEVIECGAYCLLHGKLFLPDFFTVAVEEDKPTGFWLEVDGCPNGPSWVWVEYTVDGTMFEG